MNKIKTRFIYPIFLIIFILTTIYLFIFGENGFYSHKKKLSIIFKLENVNQDFLLKIAHFNKKIKALNKLESFQVENQARSMLMKKKGDVIIKMYHKKWFEEISKKYQHQFKNEINNTINQESFFDQYKMVFGIMISLLIAYILTYFVPAKKLIPIKRKENSNI